MGRRSDHSREEIQAMAIAAAAKLVETEGFQSLTARKVAKAIGYTVGTLYHVFRNFEFYVQYATDHPDRWRLVFEHQAPRGLPTPELMKERRDVMFELVAENLREIAPDRIPHEVAHTATALWSGIHGICILALTGKLYLGGAFSMVKLIETLVDSVLNEFRHR